MIGNVGFLLPAEVLFERIPRKLQPVLSGLSIIKEIKNTGTNSILEASWRGKESKRNPGKFPGRIYCSEKPTRCLRKREANVVD